MPGKDKSTEPTINEEPGAITGPPAKKAARFSLNELTGAAKEAFGVQSEVIIAALQYKFQGRQESFTKAEVRSAVEAFRKKEVK